MHILSRQHRSEFLAIPTLVRLTMAKTGDQEAPTLLIKGTTLSLKYLLALKRAKLYVEAVEPHWVAYGVEIPDDEECPCIYWSWLEGEGEKAALIALLEGSQGYVHLFNELALDIAWAEIKFSPAPATFVRLLRTTKFWTGTDGKNAESIASRITAWRSQAELNSRLHTVTIESLNGWHDLTSTYITNRLSSSTLSITNPDEGSQQEHLVTWLIDVLSSHGAINSPQVDEPSGRRELTDVMLYDHESMFLIESKCLSIWSREKIPTRLRLSRSIRKDVEKALRQITGALKRVRSGAAVWDRQGNRIKVSPDLPAQAIILVPDLSLLSEATEFGGSRLKEFILSTKSILHILDPIQVLRLVQAAEKIADDNPTIDRVAAFDFCLNVRAENALNHLTPNFDQIFRWKTKNTP